MHYMTLDRAQQGQFLAALAGMPDYLREAYVNLSPEQTRVPGPDGTSPVEQVWHLADLEREGFAERIRRLLGEVEPYLPDFDGGKIAAERNYRLRSLDEGLAAFADARQNNITVFQSLAADSWLRSGTQEGVGKVSLCDIPAFMAQHDGFHRNEIEAWKETRARSPRPGE